jgi:hypothetical protein
LLARAVLPVQVTRVNEGYDEEEEEMDEEMGRQSGDADETGEGQGHGQPSAPNAPAPTVIVLDAPQCVEGAAGDDGARAHATAANKVEGAQSGEPEAKAGAVQDDTRPEAQEPISAATAAAEPAPAAAGEPEACKPDAPNPLNPLPAARTAADDNPAN